jgi:hypothetical protein
VDGPQTGDQPDSGVTPGPGDAPDNGDTPGAGDQPDNDDRPGAGDAPGDSSIPDPGDAPGAGNGQSPGDQPGGEGSPGSGDGAEGAIALTGVAALQEYLDGQEDNTATNPYRIKLAGINLASKAAGNALKGLYAALSRYVVLDLTGSYGEEYPNISIDTAPNKGKITEILLPPGLKTIGKNAFEKCSELVLADLGGATTLEHGAFSRCVKLETLIMEEARKIDYTSDSADGTFHNCDSLTSVFLPKVVEIGKKAFNSCDSLTTVYAPQAAVIGDSAFAGCKQLAYLTLGETPPELGDSVFVKNKPEVIYVPSSSVATYNNTDAPGWTDALKAKVRAIP